MSLLATISTELEPKEVIRILRSGLEELGAMIGVVVKDTAVSSDQIGFELHMPSKRRLKVSYSYPDEFTRATYRFRLEDGRRQLLALASIHKVAAIHGHANHMTIQTSMRGDRCSKLEIFRTGELHFVDSDEFRT